MLPSPGLRAGSGAGDCLSVSRSRRRGRHGRPLNPRRKESTMKVKTDVKAGLAPFADSDG